jgi:hypothetical protein
VSIASIDASYGDGTTVSATHPVAHVSKRALQSSAPPGSAPVVAAQMDDAATQPRRHDVPRTGPAVAVAQTQAIVMTHAVLISIQ